jgi:hypothetical protein
VDYAAFLQAAQRGQPPPLALLHGADEQLLDDALGLVLKGLFTDASEIALGREVLEGGEVSVETVVRSAMTLPFMTSRRLVIVRRAQALNARGAEELTAYARDPNPSTALLLLADEGLAASRDRRDHWLLGALPAAAVVGLPVRKGRALTASSSPTTPHASSCSGWARTARGCSARPARPRCSADRTTARSTPAR